MLAAICTLVSIVCTLVTVTIAVSDIWKEKQEKDNQDQHNGGDLDGQANPIG